MSHETWLPGPMILRHAPAAWRRCPELGCGEAGGHAGEHVPEAVPPIPLPPPLPREERETVASPAAPCSCSGHGPDPACAEHGAALRAWQREHAPRVRLDIIEPAAQALLDARDRFQSDLIESGEASSEPIYAAERRLRGALAGCPDPLRAALVELLDALDAEPGPLASQGAHRARLVTAQRAGAQALGRVPA